MQETFRQYREFFSTNPYEQLLRISWTYARGMRGRYVLIYVMFTCVNVLSSLQPILFGYFINYLQAGEGDLLTAAWIYGGAYLALILAGWAFQWPARLMERRMAFDISRRLLMETYDQVVGLPLEWHRRHHSGDTINRTRKAYEALKSFFDNGFVYFQTLVRMFISIAAIIWFSAIFGGVAGVSGVLIVLTVLAFDRPIITVTKETNERENDLLAGLSDNLGNIITVTTLRLGRQTARQIMHRLKAVWPPFLRNTQLNEQKWFTTGVLIGLMYAIIVIGYVYQNYVPGEVFLVGGLVTLIGYVNQFSNMFNALTGQYNTIIRLRADLAAIDPIVEADRTFARPASLPPSQVRKDWQTLEVRDLHFTYDPEAGERRGLADIRLTLERGKRIAFIGPSGSGKTTLLYLLRGLYPPDRITVCKSGPAIKDVLFGETSPAGRLPMGMPRVTGQQPQYYAHPPTGRPANPDPSVDSARYKDVAIGPLFPFGHGLSYARFDYSDLKIMPQGSGQSLRWSVSVTVTNTGARDADEVVQLYIHAPVPGLSRPVKELRGFSRVSIPAGQTRRVTFTLSPAQFAVWRDGWHISPGTVEVMIGASSDDIRLRGTLSNPVDRAVAADEIAGAAPATAVAIG